MRYLKEDCILYLNKSITQKENKKNEQLKNTKREESAHLGLERERVNERGII